MSQGIKVTLPHEFQPEKRAYFYQSLSVLNYFLLPGTVIQLQVKPGSESEKNLYYLEISFNNTIVKTSVETNDYQEAIKKMMSNLQGKFAEIIELINKGKSKKEKDVESKVEEDEDDKIIH